MGLVLVWAASVKLCNRRWEPEPFLRRGVLIAPTPFCGNWVKSGTSPIIPSQFGSVNQPRGGHFWCFCTKKPTCDSQRHACLPLQKSNPPMNGFWEEIFDFLGNLQRKNRKNEKKGDVFGMKIPFFDINGNKIGDSCFWENFCATGRIDLVDLSQKPAFSPFFAQKTGCFLGFERIFFLFIV